MAPQLNNLPDFGAVRPDDTMMATHVMPTGGQDASGDGRAILPASEPGLLLLVGASLFIHGHDQVAERLDDFATLAVDEIDHAAGRRRIWYANWLAFKENPWLGYGIGSHAEFYRMFLPDNVTVEEYREEQTRTQIIRVRQNVDEVITDKFYGHLVKIDA